MRGGGGQTYRRELLDMALVGGGGVVSAPNAACYASCVVCCVVCPRNAQQSFRICLKTLQIICACVFAPQESVFLDILKYIYRAIELLKLLPEKL